MAEPKATKPAKSTGRYRKVEVRTWGDEKFRALSAIQPCGKGLWLYLITGPHTGPIPGLFRAGRAAMAEDLDWELEAFDKAFGEVFRQGMVQADFKAHVMWVPNAIKHNRPESPNVVRSWAAEFDLIPECDLKREAVESLKSSIHALGEAFGKAFDETFGKTSSKASLKASPKAMPNQEQEQEQLVKKATAKTPRPSRPKKILKTFAEYIADCKAAGVMAVPADHPIRAYCQDAGITDEMRQIAWLVFRDRHMTSEKAKRQKDWPGTFANSVKGRWYKLWYVNEGGAAEWTANGLQDKRVLDARHAAAAAQQEAEHAHAA